jgi:hypothetical protein
MLLISGLFTNSLFLACPLWPNHLAVPHSHFSFQKKSPWHPKLSPNITIYTYRTAVTSSERLSQNI